MDKVNMPKPLSPIPPVGGKVSTAGQKQGKNRSTASKSPRKPVENNSDDTMQNRLNAETEEDKGLRIDIQI